MRARATAATPLNPLRFQNEFPISVILGNSNPCLLDVLPGRERPKSPSKTRPVRAHGDLDAATVDDVPDHGIFARIHDVTAGAAESGVITEAVHRIDYFASGSTVHDAATLALPDAVCQPPCTQAFPPPVA